MVTFSLQKGHQRRSGSEGRVVITSQTEVECSSNSLGLSCCEARNLCWTSPFGLETGRTDHDPNKTQLRLGSFSHVEVLLITSLNARSGEKSKEPLG